MGVPCTVSTAPNADPILQFPETKSYPFPVWSGLLNHEHHRRMGSAVWTFLWCLDRVTSELNGWGTVLGGKPVKDEEIAACFGVHVNAIRMSRKKLVRELYVEATRTPYGYRLRVRNSRKFGIWGTKRVTQKCESIDADEHESVSPERHKSVTTKKTMQLDHAKTPTPNQDGFDMFWKAYPKKIGKGDALKAWGKSVTPTDIPAVLAGLEAHKNSDQWQRGYILNPATFLNGERWKDEISGAFVPVARSRIPTASDLRPRR
jgi:hypothetical protein